MERASAGQSHYPYVSSQLQPELRMPRILLPWSPIGRKIAAQNAKRWRLIRAGLATPDNATRNAMANAEARQIEAARKLARKLEP